MIAIHDSPSGFHPRWMAYCEARGIPYRRVDCYANDIIRQLHGCTALMWHHGQSNPRDILIARQILSALEHAGLKVFPDFRTAWHFDDKVAQKYLFEALGIPAVPAHVFVDLGQTLDWVEQANFPKVFKLRRGAGSAGVRLVRDRAQARRLVRRAFGRGFSLYDPWSNLKERWYKVRMGAAPVAEIAKGLARIFYRPRYDRVLGPERGYAYFQDFVPGNDSDTRVIVIGDRACALKRFTRPKDFRASGSGLLSYDPEQVNVASIALAFKIQSLVKADCLAMDFVFDNGTPMLIEVSYGSPTSFYDACLGHWDRRLNWCEGEVDLQGWMVEEILAQPKGVGSR